jgi:hypothetical protein
MKKIAERRHSKFTATTMTMVNVNVITPAGHLTFKDTKRLYREAKRLKCATDALREIF